MLSELRAMLKEGTETVIENDTSLMMDALNDDNQFIKSAFLDDPDTMVIGAENDEAIAKFIESVPEDDEADPVTDEDIEKIAESMIPETNLGCRISADHITSVDLVSESAYSELNEEIVEERSAISDATKIDKEHQAFYDLYRQAMGEKDAKKANKLWREVKTEYNKLISAYSKIGNDTAVDKFILFFSSNIYHIDDLFQKDGYKRNTQRRIKDIGIFIDYNIKKTAGENVNYKRDYLDKIGK